MIFEGFQFQVGPFGAGFLLLLLCVFVGSFIYIYKGENASERCSVSPSGRQQLFCFGLSPIFVLFCAFSKIFFWPMWIGNWMPPKKKKSSRKVCVCVHTAVKLDSMTTPLTNEPTRNCHPLSVRHAGFWLLLDGSQTYPTISHRRTHTYTMVGPDSLETLNRLELRASSCQTVDVVLGVVCAGFSGGRWASTWACNTGKVTHLTWCGYRTISALLTGERAYSLAR